MRRATDATESGADAGEPRTCGPAQNGRSGRIVPWVLLAVLFAAEFLAFDLYGSRRVTGIYPRWNDQIQYLSEAYLGHEYAKQHGLAAAVWQTVVNPSAQGTLHDVAATVLFAVTGPSRSAALAINLFALLAWQAALFFGIRRTTGSTVLAWCSLLLPLALAGPWQNVPGSAYDFRLDHLGMCAFGVASATALLTRGLRAPGWCVVFGVATGLTLLTRFITGTYFVVIYTALLAGALMRPPRRIRLLGWVAATGAALAIALPVFWLNRETVWNYYYIGHYVGPESAIRNQNFGVGASLHFLGTHLYGRHLGAFFCALGAGVLLAGVALRRRNRRNDAHPMKAAEPCRRVAPATEGLGIAVLFLLAPVLVLTLHPQKSEVVVSVLSPGVVLLVIALWRWAAGPALEKRGRRAWPEFGLAIGATAAALAFFIVQQMRTIEHPITIANARQVNGLADYIFRITQEAKLESPRVSVDHITDALDAQVLRVIVYERHRVWKNWDMKLPTGIAEPDAGDVRQRVAESDFVFLMTGDTAPGPYPFDRKLAAMRGELLAWCNEHLRRAKDFNLSGIPFALYQRADLPTPPP